MFFEFAVLTYGLVVTLLPSRIARARYAVAQYLVIATVLVMVSGDMCHCRPSSATWQLSTVGPTAAAAPPLPHGTGRLSCVRGRATSVSGLASPASFHTLNVVFAPHACMQVALNDTISDVWFFWDKKRLFNQWSGAMQKLYLSASALAAGWVLICIFNFIWVSECERGGRGQWSEMRG